MTNMINIFIYYQVVGQWLESMSGLRYIEVVN